MAVGNLGALADDTALLRPLDDDFVLTRLGANFRSSIACEHPIPLSSLAANFRNAMTSAARQALLKGTPVLTTTHALTERAVSTCEFLALPLYEAWGGEDLILGFLRRRPTTYDMVEAIFSATSDGLIALAPVLSPTGRPGFQIVSASNGAERFFGRPKDALAWAMLADVMAPADCDGLSELLAEALRHRAPRHFDFSFRRAAGDELHVQVSASPIGELLGVAFTDVTELRRREQSMSLLFGSNPMPLLVYDPDDGRLLEANGAFLERYGYSRGDVAALRIADFSRSDDWIDAATHERERREAGRTAREREHVTASGERRHVLVHTRDLPYDGRDCVLASIVDVTEQRHAEAQIVHLAYHDTVTGLANRVRFKASLASSLSTLSRNHHLLAVHCIDLDYFKQVNDTFGHPTGDALLGAVAERLRKSVRDGDTIARLGGDEFAVVQTGIERPGEAGQLAARLVELLSAPYEIDGQQIVIGASIGVALAPADGSDADQLLKNADIALYRAKAEGRRTFAFFEIAMQRAIQHRRSLEIDLRNALLSSEFSLAFQPLVEVASGRIVGVEALLRWTHAERGVVPPSDFIPLAEETGLIVPIGEWVLRQACREATRWPKDLSVAVNLSPVQFKSRGLVAAVTSALASTGLSPARLELEITESVLLADSEANLSTLQQLRGLGVRISMDDFGTGYSSLSYLRAFPFDKIKIDRSFITDLGTNEDCRAIVRAIVGLGTSLGIRTLAEGVETHEQLTQLGLEGCQEVQGYLFSPPIPPATLLHLLETRAGLERAA